VCTHVACNRVLVCGAQRTTALWCAGAAVQRGAGVQGCLCNGEWACKDARAPGVQGPACNEAAGVRRGAGIAARRSAGTRGSVQGGECKQRARERPRISVQGGSSTRLRVGRDGRVSVQRKPRGMQKRPCAPGTIVQHKHWCAQGPSCTRNNCASVAPRTTAGDKVPACPLHTHRPLCRAGGQTPSRLPAKSVQTGGGGLQKHHLFCSFFLKKERIRLPACFQAPLPPRRRWGRGHFGGHRPPGVGGHSPCSSGSGCPRVPSAVPRRGQGGGDTAAAPPSQLGHGVGGVGLSRRRGQAELGVVAADGEEAADSQQRQQHDGRADAEHAPGARLTVAVVQNQ